MQEFLEKNWPIILIIITTVVVAYGSVVILGKNNPIEIEAEKVIEAETGLKVDLTP